MSFSKLNTCSATLTDQQQGETLDRLPGGCVTCLDGCPGFCETGESVSIDILLVDP